MTTGAGLYTLAWNLYDAGVITGGGPQEREGRRLYTESIGQPVNLRLIRPVEGVRDFAGILTGYADGRLTVRLGECRYPAADPNSDAFAQMVVTDRNSKATLFDGWMVASSPALSALDDARYDVWVMACKTA